jgi:hypothetical protein
MIGMTQKEFASLGGNARAQKLTKDRRIEIARNAGLASAEKRRVEELEKQVAVLTAKLEKQRGDPAANGA